MDRPQPPANTEADRKTMETELSDESLPEGATSKAVAGYLYFPVSVKKGKPASYELEYEEDGRKVSVTVKPN